MLTEREELTQRRSQTLDRALRPNALSRTLSRTRTPLRESERADERYSSDYFGLRRLVQELTRWTNTVVAKVHFWQTPLQRDRAE